MSHENKGLFPWADNNDAHALIKKKDSSENKYNKVLICPSSPQQWPTHFSKCPQTIPKRPSCMQSFIDVQNSCKRALPTNIYSYKYSPLLYNNQSKTLDWLDLNFYQILSLYKRIIL